MTRYQVIEGDNMAALAAMADCSVDSVCTDPPYGLGKEPDMVALLSAWLDHGYLEIGGSGFMGKQWDAFVPQPIFWKEVFRVLKPGGYVVSFGGTRTYDLMVLAVRLAGFEVRDQLVWLYGSGFPKSANVSKMIDKQAGAAKGERTTIKAGHEKHVGKDNMKALRESGALSGDGGFSRPWMHDSQKVEDAHWNFAPSTDEAKEWDGFGSALKPSHEPILLARKPLEKGLTIVQNVLKWGTGALNIDASRISHTEATKHTIRKSDGDPNFVNSGGWKESNRTANRPSTAIALGRWPSNLLLANVPSVIALFPETSAGGTPKVRNKSIFDSQPSDKPMVADARINFSSGSASRYFFRADMLPIEIEEQQLGISDKFIYCSKPSKQERNLGKTTDTSHCTVKPVALMLHLATLVTPPNGTCLDPFAGSGTTGIACMLSSPTMKVILLEMTPEYIPIIHDRLKNWKHYRQFTEAKEGDAPVKKAAAAAKSGQTSLF